jgi:hypothetical protein
MDLTTVKKSFILIFYLLPTISYSTLHIKIFRSEPSSARKEVYSGLVLAYSISGGKDPESVKEPKILRTKSITSLNLKYFRTFCHREYSFSSTFSTYSSYLHQFLSPFTISQINFEEHTHSLSTQA